MIRIDERQFVNSLLDPFTRVRFTMAGFRRVHPDFDIRNRILEENFILAIIEESCDLTLPSGRERINSGDILWLAPGVMHSLSIPSNGKPMRMYQLHFFINAGGQNIGSEDDVLVSQSRYDLTGLVDRLYDEQQIRHANKQARLVALLMILWTSLHFASGQRRSVRHGVLNISQRRFLDAFVQAHHHERPTPAKMAEHLNISPDYFARLFRRTYGMSPRKWLVRERIHHASMHMMESSSSISKLAADYGYRDVFLFSRQFKAVMGISPAKYRKL